MEKLQELIKEWYSEPEIHESYPDGLSQFLSESSDSHNDAYYLIAELLRHNMEMKEALEKAEEALEWYMTECTPDNDNYQSFHDIGMNARSVLRECLTSCNKGKE